MTRVLLDVDTGIDDALALLYAVAEARLDLVGATAAVGNVPIDVAARNSAGVLAAAGAARRPRHPTPSPTRTLARWWRGCRARPRSPSPRALPCPTSPATWTSPA